MIQPKGWVTLFFRDSFKFFESVEDMMRVHSHEGRTRFHWQDKPPEEEDMKVEMSNIRKFELHHRTDEVIRALLKEQGIEIRDDEKLSWNHKMIDRTRAKCNGTPMPSTQFDADTDLVLTVYLTSSEETPAQQAEKEAK